MKPGLIKAHEIAPQQRFITIHIPIIDTGHNAEQKIEKMHEELLELSKEFSKHEIDKSAALSEMFDVIQVMVGYLLCDAKGIVSGNGAHDYVDTQIRNGNERHVAKIKGYSDERGWLQVVR